MGQFNLNLSTRPFKQYRAANLGLIFVLLILITVSVAQVYTYQQNASLAASIRPSQQKSREESELLTRRLALLNAQMYSGNASSKIAQVEFLNQLLVRKSFSWTKVFSNLEDIMPENVYLVNLRPFIDDMGKMGLNMEIRGKSHDDAVGFVRILEHSNVFGNVAVALEEKRESASAGTEVEMALSTYYFPEKRAE